MGKSRVAQLIVALTLIVGAGAEGSVVSGSYLGTGVPRAITGVGFKPDVVIVKANSVNYRAVVRTASMGATKEMTGNALPVPGLIQSLDADGFTVNGDSRVNRAGTEYDWVAFQAVAGESKAGFYSGNGFDNRSITGLGFTPSWVVVVPDGPYPVYHRSSPMDRSYDFDNSTGDLNHVQGMLADGFQTGDDWDVNRNGTVYHYVAWKAVPGRMAVGSYVGLRNDNRSITGVGFRPVYVVLKSEDAWFAVHKPASTGPATNGSLFFNLNDEETNNIQALEADGFQVGSHERVNDYGDTIYWVAWGATDGGRLVTSRSGAKITVETPSVRMVWDENRGGGLHEYYAKTEASPGTSRGGTDAWYNLFGTGVNDGTWVREAEATGALELLEATPVRVRIRQNAVFVPGPTGSRMERDWSVYGTPRLGIDETLKFEAPLNRRGVTGLHPKGEATCGGGNTFYCAGRSDSFNRIWLATDNGTTYSDMLAIPWTNAFFARGSASPSWDNNFENTWPATPNTWVARVRETILVPTSGTDRRFYLFHPRVEGLTSGGTQWQPYANDYRSPSPLAIARGSAWIDPAESTAAGDHFNQAEAAYLLAVDPVTGLDFSIDGSATTPRRQPFFKIRQWRSLQEPATVILQGAALVRDRDFVAAVKPLAHAVFCDDAACTTSTRLARGGLVGDPNEYLADASAARNLQLGFFSPGVQHLFLGADSKFRGLNVALQQAGTGPADLRWEFWDGSAWADLEAVPGFTDLTASLTRDGALFWAADPPSWSATSVVAGGPSLYYVRASLAPGPTYGLYPIEGRIKTDILLFQYLGSVTASGRRFVLNPPSSGTYYRSIGTRPPYGTGEPVEGAGTTVAATFGSTVVRGAGTAFRTANRGRGDRIAIGGFAYTVHAVVSETDLELTEPYAEATGAGKSYVISRRFPSLVDWERCVDGTVLPCEGVSGPSLVADDRNEVGILYRDSAMPGGLVIDGSVTDPDHTITLTADHGNRHFGRTGAAGAVALVSNAGSAAAISVQDEFVTVEWLEVRGGTGGGAHGVVLTNLAPVNAVTLRGLLLHHNGSASGIEIQTPDAIVDVVDNVVYESGVGIRVNAAPTAASRIRVLNNTVYGCNQAPSGIVSTAGSNTAVTLRNNVAHSNAGADFAVPNRNPASSHNLGSDGSGVSHSAVGTGLDVAPALAETIFVSVAPGGEDLHLEPASPAVDGGADLGAPFAFDIDGGSRSSPWDRGADEATAVVADLTVTKDDLQATAVPGGTVTYTITLRNNGPAPVTHVRMADVVPPELAPAGSPPVFLAASRGTYDPGTETWNFSLAPLLAGESASVGLVVTVDPAARGTVANTATVAPLLPAGVVDPVPQNGSATDTDDLSPSADLAVAHTDSPDPVDLGALLTYTVTVTNNGPSAATGVVLTDVLPGEMELDSVSPSQGSCGFNVATSTLTCALGALAPGTATVTLAVRPRGLGTFTAMATVVRSEPDPVTGNDSAPAATTVLVPSRAVRFFTATSTSGRNVLEWVNPSTDFVSTEIWFAPDHFPSTIGDGTLLHTSVAAGYDRFVHDTPALTDGQTCYYAAFVNLSVGPPFVSPGRQVRGRPFDTSAEVKWAFSTGGFSVTPPTVGTEAILAPTNDLAVHAMARGPSGGEWPANWKPYAVGGPVQSRSPVIPLAVGASSSVMYLGSQDGYVHAIDGARGGDVPPPWPPVGLTMPLTGVQAAPAGIFSMFGAPWDYLFVGTRDMNGDNALVALDPRTGAELDRFDNGGGIGMINGQASVDYLTRRVYFTSHERSAGAPTLWCVELAAAPNVFAPCAGFTPRALGDIDGSPIVAAGRVFVGSDAANGTVYSINASTGAPADDRSYNHGDGPVKGFVFPDRASPTGDVYFATENFVWACSDSAGMNPLFGGGISLGSGVKPSPVLFTPRSHYVYVGGSDGRLYEIDVAAGPAIKSRVLGDGLSVVGAPSLDAALGLVHVGTEAGVFYAVTVPFGP